MNKGEEEAGKFLIIPRRVARIEPSFARVYFSILEDCFVP